MIASSRGSTLSNVSVIAIDTTVMGVAAWSFADAAKEFVSPADPAWQKRRTAALEDLRSHLDAQKPVHEGIAAWEKANPHPGGTIAEVADHIDHIRKVAGID